MRTRNDNHCHFNRWLYFKSPTVAIDVPLYVCDRGGVNTDIRQVNHLIDLIILYIYNYGCTEQESQVARPTDWSEPKERHQIRLTPTCWRYLDDIAAANDLPSKAEAIERLSRFAAKNYIVFERDSEAIANLDRQATAKAKQLLLYLESLPRTPETEEAMKMAVELIDSLPQLEE